jgi:Host cell surface-exposed lipoprotein
MSTINPPEHQQSSPQPSPLPAPPKRHRARKTLLIIGSAVVALIVLIVIVSVATAKPKPAADNTPPPTTSAPATPSAPTAQSYTSVQSLLTAMAAHGAPCSAVSIKTGSAVNGALSTFAECSGASSGDTAIVMFTNHADALAYANSMVTNPITPTAEVVGPDWTVNTSPAYAAKVVKAMGGQLITAPAASSPASSVSASSAPASSAPASSAPASSAPASSAPTATAPAMSAADQQAVDAAQNYLDLGSGFSAESLYNQLTSSYGSGFTSAQANFAISYLHPDWDAQAVEAAKGYMNLGGFSRDSLIQQLTSNYGNGFTYAQAEYAANQVGL